MLILLRYLHRYLPTVAAALALALVNQLCLLLDPLILQHVLDKYAVHTHGGAWHSFVMDTAPWFAAMIGSVFFAWLAKGFQISAVNKVSFQVAAAMFSDGMRTLLRMPFASFEQRRTGESVEGLKRLRRDVEDLLKTMINNAFSSAVALLFTAVYTASISWVLGPCFASIAAILVYASLVLSRRIQRVDRELYARNVQLAGNATETMRNIEFVKSVGLTEQELTRLDGSTAEILRLELRKVRTTRAYTFFHGACVHLLRIGLIVVLLFLRFEGRITMGQFLSVFLYSYFVFGPMQELGTLLIGYREAETSLRHFGALLQQEQEHHGSGLPVESLNSIAFDSVSFSYADRSEPALRDISFFAQTGEVIAFVGPSGAGKTTLIKLMLSLYQPSGGQVSFNHTAATQWNADSLRARVGLVTQDTQLFSGSIRENLLVMKPDASDAELLEKLRQAAVIEVLERAPAGLDSLIGEGGLRLSGGERQRLAIARALLREPDLLIFDEATSSLDAVTEREIADAFIGASHARPTIAVLIAHRLSTVVHADRIYVLDRGAIVESGTHDQLVRNEALYWKLWQHQALPMAERSSL